MLHISTMSFLLVLVAAGASAEANAVSEANTAETARYIAGDFGWEASKWADQAKAAAQESMARAHGVAMQRLQHAELQKERRNLAKLEFVHTRHAIRQAAAKNKLSKVKTSLKRLEQIDQQAAKHAAAIQQKLHAVDRDARVSFGRPQDRPEVVELGESEERDAALREQKVKAAQWKGEVAHWQKEANRWADSSQGAEDALQSEAVNEVHAATKLKNLETESLAKEAHKQVLTEKNRDLDAQRKAMAEESASFKQKYNQATTAEEEAKHDMQQEVSALDAEHQNEARIVTEMKDIQRAAFEEQTEVEKEATMLHSIAQTTDELVHDAKMPQAEDESDEVTLGESNSRESDEAKRISTSISRLRGEERVEPALENEERKEAQQVKQEVSSMLKDELDADRKVSKMEKESIELSTHLAADTKWTKLRDTSDLGEAAHSGYHSPVHQAQLKLNRMKMLSSKLVKDVRTSDRIRSKAVLAAARNSEQLKLAREAKRVEEETSNVRKMHTKVESEKHSDAITLDVKLNEMKRQIRAVVSDEKDADKQIAVTEREMKMHNKEEGLLSARSAP
jgi:hypothetical protein